jgi:signal transduction histidine kinase
MKLRIKLALFNLLSKLVFTLLFLLIMPYLIDRINLLQVDNDLIQKREQVISLISKVGIEPFLTSDTSKAFGSYNILKEEFISLEKIDLKEDANYIDVSQRQIEGEDIEYRVLNYSIKVDGNTYLLEVGKSLSSILYTRNNIKKVMLVFLVFIILITFLTDLQYTRLLLKPLDIITRKLKEISNPSNFDKTAVKTSTSDFKKLDNALTELMGHIDQLFRQEKEITVNISHELLTPISVIRSKLENILLQENIDEKFSIKIEESLKTLHRLQRLVNSLLLIARIDSRQYLRNDSFPISEILREIITELSPITEDKGIVLKEEFVNDFIIKDANRSLIFSMFYNVVNNAVKNTPPGGSIVIKSNLMNGKNLVTVTDTGKGINAAIMDTLFSRFRTSQEYGDKGTGIGLAITKSIADFHGIEIHVESILEKGSEFSFTFPENS